MNMFTTLSQFYNSDEWRKLRKQIINDRTNKDDGILYDEYNGQPLVKAYDIVLHHKKPLTMQNVNDYSVSLNAENIMILSQKSHNEIHARFGNTAQRKVYYVYGAPCSGKTTFVNNVKGNSDFIIDIDNIWQSITGGERYEKPNALKQIAFAVRDTMLDAVKRRVGNWERAYIIEGNASKARIRDVVAFYGAEVIHIDTDKQTCLKRLANDKNRTAEQKKQWTEYINRYFDDYAE